MENPKPLAQRLGKALMIAGFIVLLGAGGALLFWRDADFPVGAVGRQMLLVGLGTYVVGRILHWQGRRGRM